MPFKSEKQRRYLYANHPEIAEKWSKNYRDGGEVKKEGLEAKVEELEIKVRELENKARTEYQDAQEGFVAVAHLFNETFGNIDSIHDIATAATAFYIGLKKLDPPQPAVQNAIKLIEEGASDALFIYLVNKIPMPPVLKGILIVWSAAPYVLGVTRGAIATFGARFGIDVSGVTGVIEDIGEFLEVTNPRRVMTRVVTQFYKDITTVTTGPAPTEAPEGGIYGPGLYDKLQDKREEAQSYKDGGIVSYYRSGGVTKTDWSKPADHPVNQPQEDSGYEQEAYGHVGTKAEYYSQRSEERDTQPSTLIERFDRPTHGSGKTYDITTQKGLNQLIAQNPDHVQAFADAAHESDMLSDFAHRSISGNVITSEEAARANRLDHDNRVVPGAQFIGSYLDDYHSEIPGAIKAIKEGIAEGDAEFLADLDKQIPDDATVSITVGKDGSYSVDLGDTTLSNIIERHINAALNDQAAPEVTFRDAVGTVAALGPRDARRFQERATPGNVLGILQNYWNRR